MYNNENVHLGKALRLTNLNTEHYLFYKMKNFKFMAAEHMTQIY